MKVVVVGALTLSVAFSLFSQAPGRPAFEVSSVKQEASTLSKGTMSGGVCHGSDAPRPQVGIPGMVVPLGHCRYAGAKIWQLINNAYGVAPDRIVGVPGWLESLPFSIDAKAEEGSTPPRAELRQMLQVLLEDRFKLKYHRETKEVDGYALVIGKNGIKLKESAEGTRGGATSGPNNIHGSMPMTMLANELNIAAGKPVTDKTGLTARYDIDIKFIPETAARSIFQAIGIGSADPGISAAPTAAAEPTGLPSIFAAVQELGLRLEPDKTSIELFVVDSIEKPEPN